jgi:hypothetical protein
MRPYGDDTSEANGVVLGSRGAACCAPTRQDRAKTSTFAWFRRSYSWREKRVNLLLA